MCRVRFTIVIVTGSMGSQSLTILCARHSGEVCSVRHSFHLYVEIRHDVMLPKQPMGTQPLLKCMTSGDALEDEGRNF